MRGWGGGLSEGRLIGCECGRSVGCYVLMEEEEEEEEDAEAM